MISACRIAVPVVFLLSACATKLPVDLPSYNPGERYDVIDSIYEKGEPYPKATYVVFEKNKDGSPLSVHKVFKKKNEAVEFFKSDLGRFEKYDCMSFEKAATVYDVHVCDENLWKAYGADRGSLFVSRSIAGLTIVPGLIFTVSLMPIMLILDASEGSIENTKSHLKYGLTKVNVDENALKALRPSVEAVFSNNVSDEKSKALGDVDKTFQFIKKYPGVSPVEMVSFIQSRLVKEGNVEGLHKAMQKLPFDSGQFEKSLSFFRGVATFDAYSTAFYWSKKTDDAKKAQELASKEADFVRVEEMAIEHLKGKQGGYNGIFNLKITSPLKRGELSSVTGGFLLFQRAMDRGTVDFDISVDVSGDKSTGLFKYGVYDVSLKCVISLPQHFYRRSFVLGNVDSDIVKTEERVETVRLVSPAYHASKDFSFKDVTVNYSDIGAMGGKTQITLIGDPSANCGVDNVKIVR